MSKRSTYAIHLTKREQCMLFDATLQVQKRTGRTPSSAEVLKFGLHLVDLLGKYGNEVTLEDAIADAQKDEESA